MSANKLSYWIEAARLRTLPLSLSTVSLGTSTGYYYNSFDGLTFSLILLTVIGLQVLSNFANDYGDFVKGTDNEERIGPKRAIQKGIITVGAMKLALWVTSIITFISGVTLLWYSIGLFSVSFLALLFFGLLALWAAIRYTIGKNPYGYSGWGDFFVFLFFGFGTLGISYLYTKSIDFTDVLPSIFNGCMATSVLNLNNMRDIVNDAIMNKRTIPVLLGIENAKIYHCGLWFCSFFALSYHISFINLTNNYIYFVYLPILILLYLLKKIINVKQYYKIDVYLKPTSLLTFLITLIVFVCVILR